MKTIQQRVDEAVRAVTPHVESIRFGDPVDRQTWAIQFTAAATEEERTAASAALLAVPDQPTAAESEADALAAFSGGGQADLRRLLLAKAISDEAYRLGKAPGAVTAQELSALRQRIANIYKAL